jgi:hypothetical protein
LKLQGRLRASFAQWVRVPTTYAIGLSLTSFGSEFSACYKPKKKKTKKPDQPNKNKNKKTKTWTKNIRKK